MYVGLFAFLFLKCVTLATNKVLFVLLLLSCCCCWFLFLFYCKIGYCYFFISFSENFIFICSDHTCIKKACLENNNTLEVPCPSSVPAFYKQRSSLYMYFKKRLSFCAFFLYNQTERTTLLLHRPSRTRNAILMLYRTFLSFLIILNFCRKSFIYVYYY